MKLYMAAVLAISFLDIFHEGIVRGSFGSQMLPWNQCLDLRTDEIDIKRISGYENQEIPFKAVIFITKDGFRICVPHDLQWVQDAVQKMKRRPKPRAPPKRKPSARRRAVPTSRSNARTT